MNKAAIASLKAEIKRLVQLQKQDKALLSKPHEVPTSWAVITEAQRLQSSALNRSYEITGYLNLYNELRGREYRHSYKNNRWATGVSEIYADKMRKKLAALYEVAA